MSDSLDLKNQNAPSPLGRVRLIFQTPLYEVKQVVERYAPGIVSGRIKSEMKERLVKGSYLVSNTSFRVFSHDCFLLNYANASIASEMYGFRKPQIKLLKSLSRDVKRDGLAFSDFSHTVEEVFSDESSLEEKTKSAAVALSMAYSQIVRLEDALLQLEARNP